MVLLASPTIPTEILSIVKKLKNKKYRGHDLINNKASKNQRQKLSFFLPAFLMLISTILFLNRPVISSHYNHTKTRQTTR